MENSRFLPHRLQFLARSLALLTLVSSVFGQSSIAQTSGVQTSSSSSSASGASTSSVPSLVKFSGAIKGGASLMGVTFALYKDQENGAPLWEETQNVQVDSTGHYSVQLGSTLAAGIPKDIFVSGEARWLGVQPEGQSEQPRVLLLSVPYALKAGDAETVGGFPPSAFLLANSVNTNQSATSPSTSTSTPAVPPPNTAITGLGTVNFLPLWDATSDIVSSVVSQTGTGATAKIGINTTTPTTTLDVKGTETVRGAFTLPTTAPATSAAGKNSQPFSQAASAFSSTTNTAVNQSFRWQAEPAGNNTATPSATLNLLFGSGATNPTETGLKVGANGVITFAPDQTFQGTGTISGITVGPGLTGGGTSGNVSVALTGSCGSGQVLQWTSVTWTCANVLTGVAAGTDLTASTANGTTTISLDTTRVVTGVSAGTGLSGGGTGGVPTLSLDSTKVPLLSTANTFTGNQNVTGSITATGSLNGTSANLTGSIAAAVVRVEQTGGAFAANGITALTSAPSGTGVFGQASDVNGMGVLGINVSPTGGFGVMGVANSNSGVGIGVWGRGAGGTSSSIGVQAEADSANGIGLYAYNSSGGFAAKFGGAVQVMGDFGSTGNVAGNFLSAASGFTIGGSLFATGSPSLENAFDGFAGNASVTGASNTAIGSQAAFSLASGDGNTAVGKFALYSNKTGESNTAVGVGALVLNVGSNNTAVGGLAMTSNASGTNNTAVGYQAGTDSAATGLTNATAIGAFADVSASNSLVLGGINGVNTATADTNVGIGTTAPASTLDLEATAAAGSGPIVLFKNKALIASGTTGNAIDLRFAPDGGSSVTNPNAYIRVREDGSNQYGAYMSFATMADNGAGAGAIERMRITAAGNVGVGTTAPTHIFQVAQGLGAAFADSWSTYSSRRWKTNIQTLPDALAKVEQLRGVSYDLKGSGKHEIGVIAEEVGAVVPEVVSFEANGKDAQGVDYSRLTAVLIEAVKQQQRQIEKQQQQIARLTAKVGVLETSLRTTKSTNRAKLAAANKFPQP